MTDRRRSRVAALAGVLLLAALAVGTGAVSAQTTTAPDCSTVGYTTDGSGAVEVTNVSQLQCIGNTSTSTSLSDEFVLTSDINASGTDGWNGGSGFRPIGAGGTPFTGTVSGNEHNITELYINRPSSSEVGLFAETDNKAGIANLSLVDVNVTGDSIVGGLGGRMDARVTSSSVSGEVSAGGSFDSRAGGLVGRAQEGSINNSHANVTVTATASKVGGFVGGMQSGVTVANSSATGNVSSTGNEVGGFAGSVRGNIDSSSADGNVTGENEVGGFVGYVDGLNLNITGSYATGPVSGNNSVGGFVGVNRQGTEITESYSTGPVSGNESVGGFAGSNLRDGGDSLLRDVYTTGAVSGGNKTGGLVGENGAFVNESYAAGPVEGDQRVGGLVGQNGQDGETGDFFPSDGTDGVLSDSYWDTNETGQSDAIGKKGGDPGSETTGGESVTSGEIAGLTTDELKGSTAPTDLAALDFQNTWDVLEFGTDDARSYPFLLNNTQSPTPGEEEPLYAGGSGTASDPYQIADWTHLNNTRQNLGANFRLVSDLNESTSGYDEVSSSSANGGSGFAPVGDASTPFSGAFNGSGYTVSDFHIDRPNTDAVGLFGNSSGTVNHTGVENATVTGQSRVGSLVGVNNGGTVEESYATGTVSGTGVVGGVVGGNRGTVELSYATANVSASGDSIGGLVGGNTGTVTESYATGSVSGNSQVGGLVGFNGLSGTVTDGYWDVNTTGQTTSSGSADANGLTTSEMKGSAATTNMGGFDFTTTWDVVDTSDRISYPFLRNNKQAPEPGRENRYAGGDGSASNPYEIANWYELDDTRRNLDANFTLANGLNETTAGYDKVANATANSGEGFVPLGNRSAPFSGTFDGSGHAVGDLYIDRPGTSGVGLFGVIDGAVTATGVEDANATGQDRVGGLVGRNDFGTVTESYATGTVDGSGEVGGLVGDNAGTVGESYATSTVSGESAVGGLVGRNDFGTVEESYATGTVSGTARVGGFVGRNIGTVNESYATGTVSGVSDVGGLVGDDGGGFGTVNDGYWDRNTTNRSSSAGGTGLTTDQLKTNTSLAGFDFTNTWDVVSFSSDISYPFLGNNTQTPAPGLVQPLYAGGDGSASNPYEIADWYHLDNTRLNLGANFTVVDDMNESTIGYGDVASPSVNGGAGFAPIGNDSARFVGTFDGNGHSVTDLYIDRPDTADIGLFGYVDGGTVNNTVVEKANITGDFNTGGLVGVNRDGRVTDSYATGTVSMLAARGGGLVGTNLGTVAESHATANVSVPDDPNVVGGLVGDNVGTINRSYATGDVITGGSDAVGGLVGQNDGTVEMSHATGNVSGGNDGVGGLVGLAFSGSVTESYATGAVSGDSRVGGLIGDNLDTVEQSYATGAVSGDRTTGGLVGFNDRSPVNESYATGTVSGSTEVGGLVGENSGTVNESYAVGNVSGSSDVGGLVGLATGQVFSVSSVTESYAVGNVSGSSDVGGLVGQLGTGFLDPGGEVILRDSYYDTQTTEQQGAVGTIEEGDGTAELRGEVAGLPTSQLKANTSLAGFDFTNVWDVVDTNGEVSYPFLRNNTQTPAPGLASAEDGSDLYAGGDGSAANPYEIANWDHLNNTRQNLDANFTLVNELNETTAGYSSVASPSANGGKGFVPIGKTTFQGGTPFSGTFNGSGYAVSNLTIDRPSTPDVGLLGAMNGSVNNVGVVAANVTGNNTVGGLIGTGENIEIEESFVTGNVTATGTSFRGAANAGGLAGLTVGGTIQESFANTTVSGEEGARVGGLIGQSLPGEGGSATVQDSYATGDVTGDSLIGGFIGFNSGTVSESYASGNVSGNSDVGGFAGGNSGTINNAYWDLNTTNQTTSPASPNTNGLTTPEMKGSAATTNMGGFDFTNDWSVVNTNNRISYPYLRNNTQIPEPGREKRYAGGDGSASSPYEIANWYHLNDTRQNLGANFTLVADLNESTAGYDEVANTTANGGDGFAPVGTISAPFTGGFEGGGHSIAGLRINRTAPTNVGLFGRVGTAGTVANLSLADANVRIVETENSVFPNAGLLAGNSDGTVRNVSVAGNVTSPYSDLGGVAGINNGTVTRSAAAVNVSETGGGNNAGGLVGQNTGTIVESYATGTVSGAALIGGLVGQNDDAEGAGFVRDSYATANIVDPGPEVGGLVGQNTGLVERSYAAGTVPDPPFGDVGGLVGNDVVGSGTVVDSYWDINTTGQSFSAGGTGLTTAELTGTSATNNAAGFDFQSTWDVLTAGSDTAVSYPFLRNDTQTPAPGRTAADPDLRVDLLAVDDRTDSDASTVTVTVEETIGTETQNLTVSLTVDAPNGTEAYNETVTPQSLNNSSATVTFGADGGTPPVGPLAAGDGYTAIATATSDSATPATATDSFRVVPGAPACGNVTLSQSNGVFEVSTLAQLQCLGDSAAGGDLTGDYALTGDIEASATALWNGGDGFDPIGDSSGEFVGTFDGQGHTVSNLTIDRVGETGVGLFGVAGNFSSEFTVQNVNLTSANVTGGIDGGEGEVGALVGNGFTGTLQNVYVSGSVSSPLGEPGGIDAGGVGGAVGLHNSLDTENGYAAVNVSAPDGKNVGGFAGVVKSGSLGRTVATGAVNGSTNVGGLAGIVTDGTVTRSRAEGSVIDSGDNANAGGLVGVMDSGTLNRTYATGSVTFEEFGGGAGGLVGVVREDTFGDTKSVVNRSYAVGQVTAEFSDTGGLVGEIRVPFDESQQSQINDSYWDELATGEPNATGVGSVGASVTGFSTGDGTGRATEMLGSNAPGNLTAFEFTDVWTTATDDYPRFGTSFSLSLTNVTATVTEGEPIQVNGTVFNVGSQSDTQTLALTESVTGDSRSASTGPITLGAGEQAQFSLSVPTQEGDAGTGQVTVAGDDDSATRAVEIVALDQTAQLAVGAFAGEFPDSVASNDYGTVSIPVSETDDVQTENLTVTLAVDGEDETFTFTATNDTATLQNETRTFAFDVGTIGEADNYTATVTANADNANETNATTEFRVDAPAASSLSDLNIAGQGADATITEGNSESVAVNVTNTGDQSGSFDVTLEIGTSVTQTRTTSALGAGATETVTFTGVTGGLSAGNYDVNATTANDTVTGNLTVEQPATSALSDLDIAGQGADATISEGDNESVTVNVTNTGDQAGSFDVTLEIGTSVTQTQTTSTLGAGATQTVTFAGVTSGLSDGTYDLNATTANDTFSGTLTVEQPAMSALSDLDIAGQGTDATITEGDDESVTVNVTNVGNQSGSFDVTLEVGAVVTQTQTTSALDAGATETVTFSNVTGSLSADTYDVDATTANDTVTGNLTVEQPATSALSDLDIAGQGTDATITKGDSESVAVNVTNTGDQQGSFDVTLKIGTSVTKTQTTSALAAGATETVTFAGVTGGLSDGDYDVNATTANDTTTGTLTVEQPATSELSNLDIAGQGADATITEGDSESVAVTVTNTGDQAGAFDVTLEVGTSVTETQTTSTLAAGAAESVTFSAVTGGLAATDYNVSASTANDTTNGTLTVEQPATGSLFDLDIAGQGANATITEGDSESVAVNVTNTGDQQGSFDVSLEIGTSVTQTQTTSALGAGATEMVTFAGITSGLSDGDYEVNATTANDTTTGTLTVEQPATSALSDLDVAGQGTSAITTEGDNESVVVTVTNVGDQNGAFDVTLEIGTSVTQTQTTSTLGAGATERVTFASVSGGLSDGTYDVNTTTPNDTLAGTLTVEQPATSSLSELNVAGQGADATVTEGDNGSVVVNVTNVGEQSGSFDVTLEIGTTVTETQTTSTLVAGTTETVTFSGVIGGLADGTYDVNATTADGETSGTLTVEQPATSALSDLDIGGQGTDATITEGDTESVAVNVTNTGDQQGSFDVTLEIGTSVAQTQTSSTLSTGATETVTFKSVTGGLSADTYDVNTTTANDTFSGTLTVEQPATSTLSDLDIAGQGADSTITEGDNENVTVNVTNTGGQSGSFDVTLEIGTSVTQTRTTSTLGTGATETVTFSGVTGGLSADTYDVNATTANDTLTGSLTVEQPATSALSDLDIAGQDADATISEGDSEGVAVNVTNTGDQAGVFDVTLEIGTSVTETQTTSTLGAGATETVTFTGVTSGLSDGAYDVNTTTANDTLAGTLTVERPATSALSDLDIAGQGTDAIITEGDSEGVAVNVTNTGDQSGSFDVTLEIGATVTQTQTTSTLSTGATETVMFSGVTGGLLADTYDVNTTTANDTTTGTLTVERPATSKLSDLDIAGQGTDATITEGADESVAVNVTNVGDQAGSFAVTVEIGAAATQTQTTSTLAAGATETVTLASVTGGLTANTYDVNATTDNDTLAGTLTVEQPATATLSDLNIAGQGTSATITEGDSESVAVNVTNTGDQQGSFEVTLEIGTAVTQTQTTSTLAAGATETVTFAGVTSGLSGDSYDVNATTANNTTTGTLTVEQPPTSELSDLDIAGQGTSATITQGTNQSVAVNITNTGDQSGAFDVTLDIGGIVTETKTTTQLDPGATTTTLVFENVTGALAPAAFGVNATTADDETSGTLTVERPATSSLSDLDIAGQGADATLTNGTNQSVAVNVTNTGDQSGAFDVTLEIGTTVTRTQTTGTLAAGATETVAVENVTGGLASGEYGVNATTADDAVAGNLTVEQPATAVLSDLDIARQGSDATLTEGSNQSVAVNVTNVGDQPGAVTVTLEIGSTVAVTQTTGVLDAGDTETVTLQNLTGTLGDGTYGVNATTADGAVAGTLTVEQPPTAQLDSLDIAGAGANATITNGTDENVTVTLTNAGDQQGSFDATLTIADGTPSVTQNRTVVLGAGESQQVRFAGVTAGLAVGAYDVGLAAGGATVTGTLSVERPTPSTFLLSDIQPTDARVVVGSQVDITATAENVGDLLGTQPVNLTLDGLTRSTSVTLAGGANDTVRFENVDTGVLGTGEFTPKITTANDTVTGSLTVSEPIFVESYRLSATELRLDQNFSANVTVRNIDVVSQSLSVPLVVDGQTVDTANVSLAPGATRRVTLEWVPQFGEASVTVGGLAPTTVTVLGPDLNGNGLPAADTNGDGLLDDTNGDGNVSVLDVQVLFDSLDGDSPVLQPNYELFDFQDANDAVTILDVQALFNQVSTQQESTTARSN